MTDPTRPVRDQDADPEAGVRFWHQQALRLQAQRNEARTERDAAVAQRDAALALADEILAKPYGRGGDWALLSDVRRLRRALGDTSPTSPEEPT